MAMAKKAKNGEAARKYHGAHISLRTAGRFNLQRGWHFTVPFRYAANQRKQKDSEARRMHKASDTKNVRNLELDSTANRRNAKGTTRNLSLWLIPRLLIVNHS